jgi:hypothetical protein
MSRSEDRALRAIRIDRVSDAIEMTLATIAAHDSNCIILLRRSRMEIGSPRVPEKKTGSFSADWIIRDLVELIGIEPTTSQPELMASACAHPRSPHIV